MLVLCSGELLSFQRDETGPSRSSGSVGYMSDESAEDMKSSPFGSSTESDKAPGIEGNSQPGTTGPLAGRGIAGRRLGGSGRGLGSGRNSMSMSSLSSTGMPLLHPTSSTYEQYLSNVDESTEEEEGGIFF